MADPNAAADGGTPELTESADDLAGRLAAAQAAADSAAADAQKAVRDAQMRAAAEIDNIRKRAQRDVENAQRFALERFAGELLAVRDSLELAVASARGPVDAASLAAGQQATLQLLQKAFEKFSIQAINPQGTVFDPALHEAVMSRDSAGPAGQVLEVLQPGYQLNGRLLRPARVVVARAPADNP